MTAPHIVGPSGLLVEALADPSPDLMRHLLRTMINALLSEQADAVVGAEWGQPSASRTAQRNGYRHRDLDTRVGTIEVAIPKLRSRTYFPDWLLERRKRVVADAYLAGVSTRRMDKLRATLGINSRSKSLVSRMAEVLDAQVEGLPPPPLGEAGPFTFVAADDLNELWLSDITEHPTGECKVYLCAIKDAFSGRIVGYSIDSRMKARLAIAAPDNAVARRGDAAGCVVHSDYAEVRVKPKMVGLACAGAGW